MVAPSSHLPELEDRVDVGGVGWRQLLHLSLWSGWHGRTEKECLLNVSCFIEPTHQLPFIDLQLRLTGSRSQDPDLVFEYRHEYRPGSSTFTRTYLHT